MSDVSRSSLIQYSETKSILTIFLSYIKLSFMWLCEEHIIKSSLLYKRKSILKQDIFFVCLPKKKKAKLQIIVFKFGQSSIQSFKFWPFQLSPLYLVPLQFTYSGNFCYLSAVKCKKNSIVFIFYFLQFFILKNQEKQLKFSGILFFDFFYFKKINKKILEKIKK